MVIVTEVSQNGPQRDLPAVIARFAQIRQRLPALRHGGYTPQFVGHEQLAFARQIPGECIVVALNAADRPVALDLSLPVKHATRLDDVLNQSESFEVRNGAAHIAAVPPRWARIMVAS